MLTMRIFALEMVHFGELSEKKRLQCRGQGMVPVMVTCLPPPPPPPPNSTLLTSLAYCRPVTLCKTTATRQYYLDMKSQLIKLSARHAVRRVCQQLQVTCHLKTILQHFTYHTNMSPIPAALFFSFGNKRLLFSF